MKCFIILSRRHQVPGPYFMKVPLQVQATGQVTFLSPGNPWNPPLDNSIGDKLELKAAACALSCSWGETSGYGWPGTKEFVTLPSQGKLRQESKHSTFHPYISHGHWRGGTKRCHSQGRNPPGGLGASHPEPGLVKNINLIENSGVSQWWESQEALIQNAAWSSPGYMSVNVTTSLNSYQWTVNPY